VHELQQDSWLQLKYLHLLLSLEALVWFPNHAQVGFSDSPYFSLQQRTIRCKAACCRGLLSGEEEEWWAGVVQLLHHCWYPHATLTGTSVSQPLTPTLTCWQKERVSGFF